MSASSPTSTSSEDSRKPRRKPRVSAEHTLNRVRENQRRHRARQRDRVEALEVKLGETERRLVDTERQLVDAELQLAAAKEEVHRLRQERDVANAFVCLDVSQHFQELEFGIAGEGEGEGVVNGDGCLRGDGGMVVEQSGDAMLATMIPWNPATATAGTAITATTLLPSEALDSKQLPVSAPGPPPCCTEDSFPSTPAPTSAECTSCATRPPPSPSESTTLCAQAFVLISQRNVRNLDPALIRLWLNRGYRRALRAGEGCRVEDGTLRGLLEYISGM